MISSRSVLTVLLSVVTLVACSATEPPAGGPERVRGPAILLFYGDTSSVSLPVSSHVGVPFSLTVTSFGGGCIAHGGVEFTLRGLDAEVQPYRYDVRLPPNMACTRELRVFHDTVSLEFDEPGDATVRAVGIRRPGDTPYIIEHHLTVLP